MSYQVFQKRVNELVKRVGCGLSVRFSTDDDTGRHYARFSDGTTIVANRGCKRVEVRWGSGHRAYAAI